jgi:hypothetical protein
MNELDPETHALAGKLGELRLLWLDMSHARALFERLAETPQGFGDFRLAAALWTSGLITYRRCFTAGTGNGRERSYTLILEGLVDALEPQQRGLHGDALLMAERHVAHRLADDHEVEVWLEVEHGPPPRVRTVRSRRIMPMAPTHDAFEFASLAKHLADQLETECRRVELEIVASANASDVARWFTSTRESPEWFNVLAADAGSNHDDTPTTSRRAHMSRSGTHGEAGTQGKVTG